MATIYSVQTFRLKGKRLVPDQPQTARSPEAAIEQAQRLAPSKAGVIAFSQRVDIEAEIYDDPRPLIRIGELPPGLME